MNRKQSPKPRSIGIALKQVSHPRLVALGCKTCTARHLRNVQRLQALHYLAEFNCQNVKQKIHPLTTRVYRSRKNFDQSPKNHHAADQQLPEVFRLGRESAAVPDGRYSMWLGLLHAHPPPGVCVEPSRCVPAGRERLAWTARVERLAACTPPPFAFPGSPARLLPPLPVTTLPQASKGLHNSVPLHHSKRKSLFAHPPTHNEHNACTLNQRASPPQATASDVALDRDARDCADHLAENPRTLERAKHYGGPCRGGWPRGLDGVPAGVSCAGRGAPSNT
jgi:hypothetical protein